MTCQHCGFEIQEHLYEMQLSACPECGAKLVREQPASPVSHVPEEARERSHRFQFTGSAGEFFRIWIVIALPRFIETNNRSG